MGRQQILDFVPIGRLRSVTVAGVLGTAIGADAQALKDLQTPDTPLVLKAQGSFFVGGEKVEQTQGELGDLGPAATSPSTRCTCGTWCRRAATATCPVVMVHGATLTGKSWETTPDGRMGWDEYFVRKGHPVYVPDQVGRGRSGFNQAVFNDVARGLGAAGQSPALAAIQRRGRLAELPLRPERRPARSRTVSSRWPPSTSSRSRACRTSASAAAQPQSDVQGAVGSRRPVEWRGADGALAVRFVSAGSGAAQSRGDERPRARRAGPLSGNYTASRSRRWRRCRCWSSSAITATRRRASRLCPRGRLVFEGCQALIGRLKAAGGQAQMLSPAETRHPRQQPHDHAGQEQPADRRPDPEVDRRARQQATGARNERAVDVLMGVAVARSLSRPPSPCSRRRRGWRWNCEDYAALPITADNTEREHARAARPGQLPAGRTRRPPLLRERPQRAALHPRQADEGVHDVSRLQRRRRTAGAVPEIHLRSGTSRPA